MSAEYKVIKWDAGWVIQKVTPPKRTNAQPVRENVYAGFKEKIDAERLADVLQAAETFRVG